MNTAESRSIAQVELAGLSPLAERFKTWRANRPWGQRIPVELWQAAVEMARQHDVTVVAEALQVKREVLQRRLQSGEVPRGRQVGAPIFVEVPAAPLPSRGGERGLVELVHAGGSRLILHQGAAGTDELLPLVELFLRHGR